VPFGDLAALEAALDSRTAAFVVEPTLGEAGVIPAPEGYLEAARELTRKAGALLCLDEIQTGMGRTGRMWAHQWEGIAPDILSTAKALGGGFPIGAILATEEVGRHLVAGSHGSTFGGNPLGCAVAVRVLRELQGGVVENGRVVGERLRQGLLGLASGGRLAGVRGRGMLLALLLRGVAAP